MPPRRATVQSSGPALRRAARDAYRIAANQLDSPVEPHHRIGATTHVA